VNNIDATVIAQAPKLAPFIPTMRNHLASDLSVEESAINVKATTTEKLGFEGRKEGISAHAVVLLNQAEQA
jgi:2-C-methyl-D-erythritol 2,4-cyclodiphosphate synthase